MVPDCSVEGCEAKARARKLCNMHYLRLTRTGTLEPRARRVRAVCKVDGCEKLDDGSHGLCRLHIQRLRRAGDPERVRDHRRGTDHYCWKGDDASYHTVHDRLRREYGRASIYHCVDCGRGTRASEWSYDGTDPDEKFDAARGMTYSIDLERYVPRCRSCHRLFDQQRKVA